MQPHSGAIIAVIRNMLPIIKHTPALFAGKNFYVKTTRFDRNYGVVQQKYHYVVCVNHNPNSKLLTMDVGRDYACYMEIRYDGSYENWDFIKHRHTYVEEKFRMFEGSNNFTGEYKSENGIYHDLKGCALNNKIVTIEDIKKEIPDFENPESVQEYKDKGYTINCNPENLNDSVFIPPSNVNFVDFATQMQEMFSGMKQQVPDINNIQMPERVVVEE